MTELFLKAKHWHLFLLTFGIPMIFQFVLVGTMLFRIGTDANTNPEMMINFLQFFPLYMIILIAILFGWIWSVSIGLQERVPGDVQMKVTKFKIFFFIPVVYMLILMVFIGLSINGLLSNDVEQNGDSVGLWVTIIVPVHLFSMFCIFYTLYFVAKTIKTVELQRDAKFSDFAGEFFMIWFYPIGIWILQPKINQMIENEALVNNNELI